VVASSLAVPFPLGKKRDTCHRRLIGETAWSTFDRIGSFEVRINKKNEDILCEYRVDELVA